MFYLNNPAKNMYQNLSYLANREESEKKPVKKTGLLGMPMANQNKQENEEMGLPAKRVIKYMKMINDKRQELKNGDAGNTDV